MKELKYLNKHIFKYKGLLISGFLFVTISNIFSIYPARIISHSLDLIVDTIENHRIFNGFDIQVEYAKMLGITLLTFSAVIFALAILKGLFMFFMRQTLIVMSRYIEYDLKNEIFKHYQKLDYAFLKNNSTGDLMNRISEDVSRVRMYLGPAIMYSINLIVLFVLVIFMMVNVNARLTAYVLIPLPILSIAIYFVNKQILLRSELIQAQLSNLSTFVQESFSGIKVLKAFNRVSAYNDMFEKESMKYKELNMGLVKIDALFFPLIMLLIGLSTLITVFVGGVEVMRGTITAGVIAEFIIYVNMLTWPVASLGWVTSIIQRAAASQKRINEFLKIQPEIQDENIPFQTIEGKICFKDVEFTYPETGIKALNKINFEVNPGETLAIIGTTGSGKSTIANLLFRLYEVENGEILIDGKNIKSFAVSHLRSQMGYVPQEVFLFSDTIKNNIAFGITEKISDSELKDRVEKTAEYACILGSILEFEDKFETLIGERGNTLSGGQKQRISIARTIIKNPKVLVFDDCLSAVDTDTEEKILSNLKKIMQNKTSIIISHRISTVKDANQILVMDSGNIIEKGSHAELIAQRGFYYELFLKQQKETTLQM